MFIMPQIVECKLLRTNIMLLLRCNVIKISFYDLIKKISLFYFRKCNRRAV